MLCHIAHHGLVDKFNPARTEAGYPLPNSESRWPIPAISVGLGPRSGASKSQMHDQTRINKLSQILTVLELDYRFGVC